MSVAASNVTLQVTLLDPVRFPGAIKVFAREICRNDLLNFGRLHFFFPDSRLALDLSTDKTLKEARFDRHFVRVSVLVERTLGFGSLAGSCDSWPGGCAVLTGTLFEWMAQRIAAAADRQQHPRFTPAHSCAVPLSKSLHEAQGGWAWEQKTWYVTARCTAHLAARLLYSRHIHCLSCCSISLADACMQCMLAAIARRDACHGGGANALDSPLRQRPAGVSRAPPQKRGGRETHAGR